MQRQRALSWPHTALSCWNDGVKVTSSQIRPWLRSTPSPTYLNKHLHALSRHGLLISTLGSAGGLAWLPCQSGISPVALMRSAARI